MPACAHIITYILSKVNTNPALKFDKIMKKSLQEREKTKKTPSKYPCFCNVVASFGMVAMICFSETRSVRRGSRFPATAGAVPFFPGQSESVKEKTDVPNGTYRTTVRFPSFIGNNLTRILALQLGKHRFDMAMFVRKSETVVFLEKLTKTGAKICDKKHNFGFCDRLFLKF